MAFLDATQWNDLQVTGANNEKRFAELGLVDAVKDSTPATDEFIPPAAREALATASASRLWGRWAMRAPDGVRPGVSAVKLTSRSLSSATARKVPASAVSNISLLLL